MATSGTQCLRISGETVKGECISLNPSDVSSTCTADFQSCYFWMQGKVNAFTSRSLSTSRRRLHEIVGCIISWYGGSATSLGHFFCKIGQKPLSRTQQNIIVQGNPGDASEGAKNKFRHQFHHARLNLCFPATSSMVHDLLILDNMLAGNPRFVVASIFDQGPQQTQDLHTKNITSHDALGTFQFTCTV